MICTNLNPMIVIGVGIIIALIILISNNFRKQRDLKEALMMGEAISEFERLLAKEKEHANL